MEASADRMRETNRLVQTTKTIMQRNKVNSLFMPDQMKNEVQLASLRALLNDPVKDRRNATSLFRICEKMPLY